MAPTRCSQAGRGLALMAMLLCTQMVVANSHSGGDKAVQCSNHICKGRSSHRESHEVKSFVLVHGMGGGAWFWHEIITLLERHGYNATAVDLTSHGVNKAVADNVTTVPQYTQPLIDAIAGADGKVILVGHSLGGGSIAYASEIFPTKVSKAIYLSAVTPSYGQSMFSGFPPNTFPNLVKKGHVSFNSAKGALTPTSATVSRDTLAQYYMSQTPKRYINLAKVLMTDTPYAPGLQVLPLSEAKFGTVRRFYIRTGKDKGVLPEDQDAMIAANPPEKLFCLPNGDHAVFFSAPKRLFRLLTCISKQ